MSNETIVGVIRTQNLVAAGAATDGSAVEIKTVTSSRICFQTKGTYTAAGGLSVQICLDEGVTWVTLAAATTVTRQSTGVATATVTSAEQDIYEVRCPGCTRMRITALGAVTGTVEVLIRSTTLAP
jgi:hypothetical protein